MNWLLELKDTQSKETAKAGGKGASLAKLVEGGFPVPEAVIIPAQVFDLVMTGYPSLKDQLKKIDYKNPNSVKENSEQIRNNIENLTLAPDLEKALEKRIASFLSKGVAVRSSATLEDLQTSAFAGQHDTFLQLTSLQEVFQAIKKCYCSLYSERALFYRYERGFMLQEICMAVVIQKMIAADASGVTFTMNPIDANIQQAVINSAYGLGELVVSGEGEIDQFVVEKSTGQILEENIGKKTYRIIPQAQGTEKEAVPEKLQDLPSLTKDKIKDLVKLCSKVEEYIGFPQDIEWAMLDKTINILQSRPITKFPERWTRDESAERFPNVISPLTWDYASESFHNSLAYSLNLMNLPMVSGRWFERFNGYIYGNQALVELFEVLIKRPIREITNLKTLRMKIPNFYKDYKWILELPQRWNRDLDEYLKKVGAMEKIDPKQLEDQALYQYAFDIYKEGSYYFLPNIAISLGQGFLHRVLIQFLSLLYSKDEAPTIYNNLTAYCETKTGIVNADFYNLKQLIINNSELSNLIQNKDRRTVWESQELKNFPEFNQAFETFLMVHGHREVEPDIYHAAWRERPWIVLENLKLSLAKNEILDLTERELDLKKTQFMAEQTLFKHCPSDLHFFIAEIIHLVRLYTSLDDIEHYQTSRLSLPVRRAVIEIGNRWHKMGILETPQDIFFLRKTDLDKTLSGQLPDPKELRQKAKLERAAYEAAANISPPWNLGENEAVLSMSKDIMKGIPGSPGKAESTVCLLHSANDFDSFVPGSILVARTTNPGWTPLFYSAAAVITESGGPLSHGAVTAREIGIPAVMSVRNVLNILKDGMRVRVDGSTGSVQIIT